MNDVPHMNKDRVKCRLGCYVRCKDAMMFEACCSGLANKLRDIVRQNVFALEFFIFSILNLD